MRVIAQHILRGLWHLNRAEMTIQGVWDSGELLATESSLKKLRALVRALGFKIVVIDDGR